MIDPSIAAPSQDIEMNESGVFVAITTSPSRENILFV